MIVENGWKGRVATNRPLRPAGLGPPGTIRGRNKGRHRFVGARHPEQNTQFSIGHPADAQKIDDNVLIRTELASAETLITPSPGGRGGWGEKSARRAKSGRRGLGRSEGAINNKKKRCVGR